MTFGSGSFDVADNGLMNMMLGPELSRPMVQSLHACVAIGFVLGKSKTMHTYLHVLAFFGPTQKRKIPIAALETSGHNLRVYTK